MNILLIVVMTVVFANSENVINITKCKGCHGANFEKSALNFSKNVSEMTKTDIESSLLGYQNGTYGGKFAGVMKAQVKDFNEKDIKHISEFIEEMFQNKK